MVSNTRKNDWIKGCLIDAAQLLKGCLLFSNRLNKKQQERLIDLCISGLLESQCTKSYRIFEQILKWIGPEEYQSWQQLQCNARLIFARKQGVTSSACFCRNQLDELTYTHPKPLKP